MTPDEDRILRFIATDLRDLAHASPHEFDQTFIKVRRAFLTGLADQLIAVVTPRDPEHPRSRR